MTAVQHPISATPQGGRRFLKTDWFPDSKCSVTFFTSYQIELKYSQVTVTYQAIRHGLHAHIKVHVVFIVACWLVNTHGWL